MMGLFKYIKGYNVKRRNIFTDLRQITSIMLMLEGKILIVL